MTRRNRRAGFTMVEMLMVMIVLGLLTSIGLLKYIDLRATARTAAMVADFQSVTLASFNYYADREEWPPEAGPGQVPNGLNQYLPGQLVDGFDRTYYLLDYENIRIDDTPLIAVALTTTDARLMNKLVTGYATRAPFFMNGSKLSYLIAGPGGVF